MSEVVRCNAPTTGGASISVGGLNFGGSNLGATVMIVTSLCSPASWASDTGIVCLSTVGTGSNVMSMTVEALTGCCTAAFTYDGIELFVLPLFA